MELTCDLHTENRNGATLNQLPSLLHSEFRICWQLINESGSLIDWPSPASLTPLSPSLHIPPPCPPTPQPVHRLYSPLALKFSVNLLPGSLKVSNHITRAEFWQRMERTGTYFHLIDLFPSYPSVHSLAILSNLSHSQLIIHQLLHPKFLSPIYWLISLVSLTYPLVYWAWPPTFDGWFASGADILNIFWGFFLLWTTRDVFW